MNINPKLGKVQVNDSVLTNFVSLSGYSNHHPSQKEELQIQWNPLPTIKSQLL